mgnify:CR=1 FL=1|jgi:hypothetical protein
MNIAVKREKQNKLVANLLKIDSVPTSVEWLVPSGVELRAIPEFGIVSDKTPHRGCAYVYLGSDNRMYSYINKLAKVVDKEFESDTHIGFKLGSSIIVIEKDPKPTGQLSLLEENKNSDRPL